MKLIGRRPSTGSTKQKKSQADQSDTTHVDDEKHSRDKDLAKVDKNLSVKFAQGQRKKGNSAKQTDALCEPPKYRAHHGEGLPAYVQPCASAAVLKSASSAVSDVRVDVLVAQRKLAQKIRAFDDQAPLEPYARQVAMVSEVWGLRQDADPLSQVAARAKSVVAHSQAVSQQNSSWSDHCFVVEGGQSSATGGANATQGGIDDPAIRHVGDMTLWGAQVQRLFAGEVLRIGDHLASLIQAIESWSKMRAKLLVLLPSHSQIEMSAQPHVQALRKAFLRDDAQLGRDIAMIMQAMSGWQTALHVLGETDEYSPVATDVLDALVAHYQQFYAHLQQPKLAQTDLRKSLSDVVLQIVSPHFEVDAPYDASQAQRLKIYQAFWRKPEQQKTLGAARALTDRFCLVLAGCRAAMRVRINNPLHPLQELVFVDLNSMGHFCDIAQKQLSMLDHFLQDKLFAVREHLAVALRSMTPGEQSSRADLEALHRQRLTRVRKKSQ